MSNIVPCKRCNKDFDYSPSPAGNARQLCEECRYITDEEEVIALTEEMIIEGNKYLVGAPKRKEKYDPLEIMDGNFPEFQSDVDKYVCAIEFGKFINRNGLGNREENIAKFLEHLGLLHAVCCVQQWTVQSTEQIAKHPAFKSIIRKLMQIA